MDPWRQCDSKLSVSMLLLFCIKQVLDETRLSTALTFYKILEIYEDEEEEEKAESPMFTIIFG